MQCECNAIFNDIVNALLRWTQKPFHSMYHNYRNVVLRDIKDKYFGRRQKLQHVFVYLCHCCIEFQSNSFRAYIVGEFHI